MSLLDREPVRAAFLTATTAVLGLLVALDVIDDGASAGISAAVVALVGLTAELTRARVTPMTATDPTIYNVTGPVIATDPARLREELQRRLDDGRVNLDGVVTIALGIVVAVVLLWLLAKIF